MKANNTIKKSPALKADTHTECVSEFLLIFVCACLLCFVSCGMVFYFGFRSDCEHKWLFGMASRSAIIQLKLIFGHFLCPLLDMSILNGGPTIFTIALCFSPFGPYCNSFIVLSLSFQSIDTILYVVVWHC